MKRLACAAVVGMLSILTLAAPGYAAPAPLTDAQVDRMIAEAAATLPAPQSAEWVARKAGPQTFTLRPSAGTTKTTAAVVTCSAFSQVLRNDGGGFFLAVGEASSSCPAPVDYLSAKATLYFWVPDLNRWEISQYGSLAVATPYREPGEAVTSVASSNCRAAYFAVLGIHQARLGSSTAAARTESNYVQFTCGG
ncbi:hypothetical protein ACN267_18295 [Micromonospora sp. WMMD734]|uniref:Ig-like domain-containing protein n=1 Tax=Micromonospora humidisoli TaxID=2807622 RepID=A0ABS2J6K2_9ACTN|nr:hypothetical protein [Micromonospora humidisoli]MBM7081333.1 hypothetical protein [Micromonospora humidisoli]